MADAFNRDLFSVLEDNPEEAAAVVEALEAMCSPWRLDVPHTAKTWADVRRSLISDEDYEVVAHGYDVLQVPPDKAIQCLWTSQHGDLHGANILVDDTLRPVLIDFGRTGEAPGVLDPVTLELSALFHPDSPLAADPWPSAHDLENWADLDRYLDDCPYPEFVAACRRWATAANVGQRDLFATVSAFCLRNLQYGDVDKDRALVLQRTASAYVKEA